MGYMRHHTIVCCGVNFGESKKYCKVKIDIKDAHKEAKEIFNYVSPLSPATTNGYRSFFIPPDGSKEGWEESDKENENREKFIKWLKSIRYKDGSSLVNWVEVQFADDEGVLLVREK